ncbi:molybdate ABC transporter substrate-binding protein [Reinekea blandensis]|uniref:Molybdenum ABC transporter, substrate binding periplasmic protein (ModA) n=1 Tax=Reinekea blandensis MED297 TaxID=314283 RepID=A4BI44_9GAMM|nr:molybdate ABC transporter substrate-binding protein [Reinekea blandensis]EAR08187.1 molybdenum ABC transporter, substrate binding periplasmic protein (ModA) [Reinekea sp. MED297] [Reinekea blandensis MED297]
MVRRSVLILILLACVWASAEERLNVAVTASFRPVLDHLAADFEAQSGIRLNLSSASTGVLYQQIRNGAPFDLFFAADRARPELLQQQWSLVESRRQTYAIGQLVLVSDDPAVQTVADLSQYEGRVVIANPALAPYGEAAQAVLDAQRFPGTPILANNVSQARQYLSMKLARVGLIAASVASGLNWVQDVPDQDAISLEQQLLVLTDHSANAQFLQYLQKKSSQAVFRQFGYRLPGDPS